MQPAPPIEPEGTFHGLQPGPILLGAVVDIVATVVGSVLLIVWLGPAVLSEGEREAAEALAELNASTGFVLANLAVGSLATVLGACLGARAAGRLHVRHGGWIAVTGTALSMLFLLVEPASAQDPTVTYPFWAELIGWLLILPSGVAGGALAKALGDAHPG